MGRTTHREVHERLTEWADSAPPLPSSDLARFMGPVRPRTALGSNRAVRAAVRTGLGLKVFGLLAAMAVTGAAAVGVTQVAQHEPEPATPVTVPAAPSAGPDLTPTAAPDDDPSSAASASPTAAPRPRTTPSAPAAPRVHRTHPAEPGPRPHPSSHESEAPDPSSSDGPDQPEPTSEPASADLAPMD